MVKTKNFIGQEKKLLTYLQQKIYFYKAEIYLTSSDFSNAAQYFYNALVFIFKKNIKK